MNDQQQNSRDWLLDKGELVEQPFVSSIPLIGPIIAWIRTQWNSVAAKWYIRPLLEQQNEYNRLLVERVRVFENYVYDLSSEQDHEISRLRHDVAALHMQLKRLNEQLENLNNRLEQIDVGEQHSGESKVL